VGLGESRTHGLIVRKSMFIQRFSRPSKNVLIYQVTVDDPIVLAKPFTSAPLRWSLAQGANDKWKPRCSCGVRFFDAVMMVATVLAE